MLSSAKLIFGTLLFCLLFAQLHAQNIHNEIPKSLDISQKFIFYLHGKIVEDQGANAVSVRFGPYRYDKIVSVLAKQGFEVISEVRPKNTNPWNYARKVAAQIDTLLARGAPPQNITVVGASKGAGVTVLVSHLLKNRELNFVPMAICGARMIEYWKKNDICLYGNVLAIVDAKDDLAGSCEAYFSYCRSRNTGTFEESILEVGSGHGILYQPLDDWVKPVVAFATRHAISPEEE